MKSGKKLNISIRNTNTYSNTLTAKPKMKTSFIVSSFYMENGDNNFCI
ncbi:hypothetical protein HNP38_003049 [Chryseobacterium defluvii]|uniref:Uncharacterized protein n=1 Tax=Chryseobacterium defluvii TaxID=160396 RepID=A0A840KJP5_9FLAO|nr:hypothetical protein [Chryseobacterium defluvii]